MMRWCQKYEERAKLDRERYNRELDAFHEAGGVLPTAKGAKGDVDPTACILPAARVKRLIKLDPDVKAVSKEANVAITKATVRAHDLSVCAGGIHLRRR